MQPGGLDDRVALVTGAGGSIGRATALQLARAGCDTGIVDSVEHAARKTAHEVEAIGRKAFVVMADLTKRSDAQRAVDETVRHFRTIEFLVNTVGWYPPSGESPSFEAHIHPWRGSSARHFPAHSQLGVLVRSFRLIWLHLFARGFVSALRAAP